MIRVLGAFPGSKPGSLVARRVTAYVMRSSFESWVPKFERQWHRRAETLCRRLHLLHTAHRRHSRLCLRGGLFRALCFPFPPFCHSVSYLQICNCKFDNCRDQILSVFPANYVVFHLSSLPMQSDKSPPSVGLC